ncbi:MAG: aminoglycoside phosphotransferase family protein [Nanoarchaeota archaeon]
MNKYSYEQAYKTASNLLPKGFTSIERGRNNWVFEHEDRILMIPRHERVKNYSVRVKATQFLHSNGIPVSEILDYSPENNGSPEYLLVKRVDGEHIDLSKSTLLERERVHRSVGEILGAMHNLSSLGYGRLKPNLIGENGSWVDFTDKFFTESIEYVKKSPELYSRFGGILEEEYQKGRNNLINIFLPSFLHADFHLDNLLFKNEQISAVLDLDIVSSGDSNWDSGHYCHTFNIDRINGVRSFRLGYNKAHDYVRERLYCLMIWTRKIGSQAIQRPEALKETLPELEKILGDEI